MTSRRWGTLVPTLVFSLTLTAAGSARAQFGIQSIADNPAVSQLGAGYGAGITFGVSSFDFISTGCGSCGGYGVFDASPGPGYGPAGGGGYGVFDAFTGPGYGPAGGGGYGVFDAFPNPGYGLAGGGGYVFPNPGYGLAGGRRPQTTASNQSTSDVVATVPGRSGSTHRVRRRR